MTYLDHLLPRTLLLFGIAAAPACSGEEARGDGMPFDPTLSAIQTNVFMVSCVFSSCHSTDGHESELVLESPVAHQNLVNVRPHNLEAAAEGLVRVAPGDPDRSLLLIKLRAPVPPGYGDLMPQGSSQGLSADEVEVVRAWIAAGAKDD